MRCKTGSPPTYQTSQSFIHYLHFRSPVCLGQAIFGFSSRAIFGKPERYYICTSGLYHFYLLTTSVLYTVAHVHISTLYLLLSYCWLHIGSSWIELRPIWGELDTFLSTFFFTKSRLVPLKMVSDVPVFRLLITKYS